MRLAILRAEAVKQGKGTTATELMGITVEKFGNLKGFFFGQQAIISDGEAGVYIIAYKGENASNYAMDPYTRTGSFAVNTHGLALEDTDVTTGWTIEWVKDSNIATIKYSDVAVVLSNTGNTSVHRDGGGYVMAFSNLNCYKSITYKSDWTGQFTLVPEKSGDLSLQTLKSSKFTMNGFGSGQSFTTFDGKVAADMSYDVSDGEYNPSRTAYAVRIIGGTEVAKLTNASQYNSATYPSDVVTYKWRVVDNTLLWTIAYNDVLVNLP